MTPWRDYLINTCFTHTWMIYTPLLPRELDFSEILGLRAPKPTLVLNDRDDDLFTVPEMERAADICAPSMPSGGQGALSLLVLPGAAHVFDLAMQAEAFAWFERWLKIAHCPLMRYPL